MLRRGLLIAVAAAATCSVAPASAGAAGWPGRLFTIPGTRVQDIAEAADGGILQGTGTQWGVHVRELRPDGSVRTLVQTIPPVIDPMVGYGPSAAMGIAAEPDGGALVLQGYDSRLMRFPATGGPTVLAGTGVPGFSGDGGPATDAQIRGGGPTGAGIVRTADGSIVFTDGGNNRLRRVRPDGLIDTLAGSGGPAATTVPRCPARNGDGGPASSAVLCSPSDVSVMADGGLLVSETGDVRRIAPDGTITTIAGGGSKPVLDGKPAARVWLDRPTAVAQLPNGDIVFDDVSGQIYRVARDGTLHMLLDTLQIHDFAGRRLGPGYFVGGLATTREGGLLIAAGDAYYLAPERTTRTLVAIRGARVSRRHVTAVVDATQPARATVQVWRGGHAPARAAFRIRAGRRPLRVPGRFSSRPHTVRVTVRSADGAIAQDEVRLYTGERLRMAYTRRLVPAVLELDELGPQRGCTRITARRIDCAFAEGGQGAALTLAFTLRPSGIVWKRTYRPADAGHPFERHPHWSSGSPAEPLGAPDV